ncbi:MFS transporter [Beijerinckia sp. L45]|uniref:MFS transporter n=1 Tax=Beijerinckia sp. L45 TaxID=1641855 RepID=UPI00131DF069|nr:MFS transporter [Beijerinckia sp. L45]
MQISDTARRDEAGAPPSKSRNLLVACLAHAMHDGYTDGIYAFLPVWQAQFELSYAGLAVVRALYYGTMGGLQLPSDKLSRRFSPRAALALSTFIAAAGFLIMAFPIGFAGLCIGLVVAGVGSSIQHPRGSLLVSDTYGTASRGPLGIYNFAGDLGKATLPAIAALLLPIFTWRPVIGMMAILGMLVTLGLLYLAPTGHATPTEATKKTAIGRSRSGFGLLAVIGAFDTSTRMGYLLFLPFLIHGRGGTSATVGLGLALLFIGGALGKATCNWLQGSMGVVGAVVVTEAATALMNAATLFTPLTATLVILPVLGVVLNGTSSVLYGTVPELAPSGDTGRAFAIFYTSVIGSGGVAPIVYGAIADHSSQSTGILSAAATAALIIPLVIALRPHLESHRT